MAAAAAGLAYGFDELGLSSIWAEALEANVASVRILQRLGMVDIGRGAEEPFAGVPSVYHQYRVTHSEWKRGGTEGNRTTRSEERRVGKECSARETPEHRTTKKGDAGG